MLTLNTPGFKGSSVKWSPFFENSIALSASQNYGLVGNGRLYLLYLGPDGIGVHKVFETQDALYDVCWSEAHGQQLLVACGDGSVKLFDARRDSFPIGVWPEHSREVYSVHWNPIGKDTFLSSSWDGSVRIYHPERDQSITVLPVASCTYSAQWAPSENGIVSCVSSDARLRLYDLRTPASAQNHLVLTMMNNATPPTIGQVPPPYFPPNEVLTHDWNKYRNTVIATGSTDQTIRVFDTRQPTRPYGVLPGHDFAVRKVTWSPHLAEFFASGSYDMTARIWSDGTHQPPDISNDMAGYKRLANGAWQFGVGKELLRFSAHTEFVAGVDWSLFGQPGWIATAGWDEKLHIWDVQSPDVRRSAS